jgi:hypothetical protein
MSMILYGIESEDECREKIDELLGQVEEAEQNASKETVSAVVSSLVAYHKQGNSLRAQSRMSGVERRYFWPAISEAHAYRPNLAKPRTWKESLEEVEYKLKKYRP